MSFRNGFKRWMAAVLLLLLLLAGSTAYMAAKDFSAERESSPAHVMNQVRLAVNPLMLYLEQNHERSGTEEAQAELKRLAAASKVDLAYARLDGTVSFRSSDSLLPGVDNANRELHYDLYSAKREFKIAFPVLDEISQKQVGNAIYFLAKDRLVQPESALRPALLLLVLAVSFLSIASLLFYMRWSIDRRLLSPLVRLKRHAEEIRKGNYGETAAYPEAGEMGDLYAMFDGMRMELLHSSIRKNKQDQAQKELIANISHEIKTPITTIKAYADAILEDVCTDKETMLDYVGVMRSHIDKMGRLTEDLLLHALRYLGRIAVEPREQYSRDVFRRMLTPIGHYVRTSGLSYVEPENMPNVLIGIDAVRIEQVISNLVFNSIKNSSPGDTIQVDAGLEAGKLKITVSDTGRGILPQDMPFILERYYRGQPPSDSGMIPQTGTGIGLSICKTIVEAHGGSLSFASKQGQGTAFSFTLPLS